jgi:hypothetical protein
VLASEPVSALLSVLASVPVSALGLAPACYLQHLSRSSNLL